ncbi:MAG: DUF305 domain-containing protein [Ilumatobacteraceae bacterium]
MSAAMGCSSPDDEPTGAASSTPSDADVGFSRDMAAHHAQAVDMAERIRARTADPRLRSLATDIVLTQQAQIGRMQGWLELWGEPFTSTDPPMGWTDSATGMDHGADSGAMTAMPGLAGPADLAALDSLDLPDAERRFLELMIEHHRGGVEMAEMAIATEPTDVVANLAESIVVGQSAEIDLLESLLAERTVPEGDS